MKKHWSQRMPIWPFFLLPSAVGIAVFGIPYLHPIDLVPVINVHVNGAFFTEGGVSASETLRLIAAIVAHIVPITLRIIRFRKDSKANAECCPAGQT